MKLRINENEQSNTRVKQYPQGVNVEIYKWVDPGDLIYVYTVEDVVEIEEGNNFFYLTPRNKHWIEYCKDSLFGDSYKFKVEGEGFRQ